MVRKQSQCNADACVRPTEANKTTSIGYLCVVLLVVVVLVSYNQQNVIVLLSEFNVLCHIPPLIV